MKIEVDKSMLIHMIKGAKFRHIPDEECFKALGHHFSEPNGDVWWDNLDLLNEPNLLGLYLLLKNYNN